MFRLVYVSTATHLFSQAELVDLLAQARVKNQRLGVTGMLLYHDGNFMQVLEGEEAVVRELFACIERDPRHHGSIVLLEEHVDRQHPDHETRVFADWSMGFRNLADADIQTVEGINDFLNVSLNDDKNIKNHSDCWNLLKLFRKNQR